MQRLSLVLWALLITAIAAGDAWAQRGGGRGFGRGGGGGDTGLLLQESVQSELKLSDEQTQKLTEFAEKQRESFTGLQDLSREERREKFAEMQKAGREAIGKILDEGQLKRFKQISLQQRGASALGDPEVATAVGLSDDQKSKIESLGEELRGVLRDAFQGGGGDREELRQKIDSMSKETNEKMQGLLTPEQQTKWKELLGEPFKGEIRRRGRPGGGRPGGDAQNRRFADFFRFASLKADSDDDEDDEKAEGKKDDGDDKPAKVKKTAKDSGKRAKRDHARHGRHARHAHRGEHPGHARHRPPGTLERRVGGPGDHGPHAEIWARIAAATRHHGHGHRGHSAFDGRGPMAWHGHHSMHGPGFAHRGPAFGHGPGPRDSHRFAHDHPHGPHHHHHFASWRSHHDGHGPAFFHRPLHAPDHEMAGSPRGDRSQADRLAQLERSRERLAREIDELRRSLKH